MAETKVSFRQIDKIFFVLFFVSWLNSLLGLLFYVALMLYWQYGAEGGLKALIFLTTRGILSAAVAATPMFPSIRWVIIIGSSLMIFFNARLSGKNKDKFNIVVLCVIGFDFVGVVSCFYICSYPVTSAFKLLCYSVAFLAVLLSIGATSRRVDWKKFVLTLYVPLFFISFFLIPFNRFRIVNNDFQGVFNHVNMFGIVAAVIITFLLGAEVFEKHKMARILIVLAMVTMIFLSASRTGMFTSLGAILLYVFFNKKSVSKKVLYIAIVGSIIFLLISFNNDFSDIVAEFVFKQGEESIWYSRQDIITIYKEHYSMSQLLGTGFLVPYVNDLVDFGLYFDLTVEPGNMFWMLLGDLGILGLLSFVLMILLICKMGTVSKLYMLATPLLICMGEMVFFNPNNISILLYTLIGLYLFDGNCMEIYDERGKKQNRVD